MKLKGFLSSMPSGRTSQQKLEPGIESTGQQSSCRWPSLPLCHGYTNHKVLSIVPIDGLPLLPKAKLQLLVKTHNNGWRRGSTRTSDKPRFTSLASRKAVLAVCASATLIRKHTGV